MAITIGGAILDLMMPIEMVLMRNNVKIYARRMGVDYLIMSGFVGYTKGFNKEYSDNPTLHERRKRARVTALVAPFFIPAREFVKLGTKDWNGYT